MSLSLHSRRDRRGRQRPALRRRQLGPVLVLATLVVAGAGLLVSSRLAGARTHLLLAGSDLQASRHALSQRDAAAARDRLGRAAAHLRSAQAKATTAPLGLLGRFPVAGSPVRAAADAARGGLAAVAAGSAIVDASSSFPTSASAAVDGHDLSAFHGAAVRSQQAVAVARRHLLRARATLSGPAGAVLPLVSAPARAMRDEIDRGVRELDGAGRGLTLLADLTGPTTEARLLLLAQDSLELRPTGGYIGSYGVLHFSRGTVTLEKYEATEDLPAPTPPATPPPELARYLPRHWGLSNANWWPDFPTSAAAAGELFRRQGGGDIHGVLALTELASARLVGALGFVKLPSYPEPVVEEGFEERIVRELELKRPLDQPRKKFLVELATAMIDRLFDLPADKLPAVTGAFRRSIAAGDIQLWFADPAWQRQLAGTVMAGALPRTEADFLMVVDSNMVASKANLDLRKDVHYKVERVSGGRFVGHVRVELRNEGRKTPINPFYGSHLRVYAPAGARLLGADGAQTAQPAADGPFEVFSQQIVVDPEANGVATFDYELPERVAADGRYELTWVRQPGTPHDRLRVDVAGASAQSDPAKRSLVVERTMAR